MHRRSWVLGLAAAVALAACKDKKPGPSAGAAGSGTSKKKTRIAVIPKGTTHEFWKSVHAGAVKASRELDVEIVWKGPLKEDDLKSQIELVQTFVAQRVSGIVLAPLSDRALVRPVKNAVEAKVPVVIFDSDLKGEDHLAFVATDNLSAGMIAGDHMAKLLDGKGSVVVLRYLEGSASTTNRERGFLAAIRKHPGIKVVSENQFGGATTESSFSTSESLLAAQKAATGGISGVFAPNESTTFGMLLALRKAGLAGKIRFIGFDASDKLVGGVREGHLDAIVVQDPFKMGYLSVKTMVQSLRGAPIEREVDTGATLVTKQNLETPAVKQLIHPDLKKWLGE